jgi:2-methylisocitrate lyase-like PEP mutase family enzyme
VTVLCARLRELHASGTFVILNAWDVGSARFLAAAGAPALATTSSGFAASIGRRDQRVTRDELVAHVASLVAAVDIPISVDAEFGYADDLAGLGETVGLLSDAGAAGFSLEDYDPAAGNVIGVESAADRIALAKRVAAEVGGPDGSMVLTARAENHLYGAGDLDDTIARLQAYRTAGADVVYAPGLKDLGDIRRVVGEVDAPVNVLALRGGPTIGELAEAGVRRVSVGGALAFLAYGAAVEAARELLGAGTIECLQHTLDSSFRNAALGE